jgi:acyl-CoA synthetase (NDP forming)
MPTLSVLDSLKVLEKYGIPTVQHAFVKRDIELGKACAKLKYPVAMKIVSSTVSHKTDVGGIKLNLHNLEEARQAFLELSTIPGFEGALVQKQVKGREIIIGGKQDEQFGPTVLFGLGGIFVEIFKDASVRVCPITQKDATNMITEIKGYKILQGARGSKAVNIPALKKVLLQANKLMQHEKIKELDINPLIANEKHVLAVDARVVV